MKKKFRFNAIHACVFDLLAAAKPNLHVSHDPINLVRSLVVPFENNASIASSAADFVVTSNYNSPWEPDMSKREEKIPIRKHHSTRRL